ncbi:MAG: hypothetical protein LBS36_04000 [Oscillospiraceae bacterium]|nr:hypothetical protein [Oscillospiraceae bacterium]
MNEEKKMRLTVTAISNGRRCRHGHKVGDTYILCGDEVAGLCARNKKQVLRLLHELSDGGILVCPDRAVTFAVDYVE